MLVGHSSHQFQTLLRADPCPALVRHMGSSRGHLRRTRVRRRRTTPRTLVLLTQRMVSIGSRRGQWISTPLRQQQTTSPTIHPMTITITQTRTLVTAIGSSCGQWPYARISHHLATWLILLIANLRINKASPPMALVGLMGSRRGRVRPAGDI